MPRVMGLDFGTTNSAIGVADEGGGVALATFHMGERLTSTFRSVLFFDADTHVASRRPQPFTGNQAIERYLEADGPGRLIQSTKSYLASHLFESTQIFNHTMTLEALIGFLLSDLRRAAEQQFGGPIGTTVVGRPVHFARAEGTEDDAFALERLSRALRESGFGEVVFEYEPVGAAYHYEASLDHDELILIADFGGGTSDFCLMEVGPTARRLGHPPSSILATDGVAIAGDAFDARLIRQLVAGAVGLGSKYRGFTDEQEIPAWPFVRLERWHHLSFLKSRKTMQMLLELKEKSLEPEKLAWLIHVINYDLGYYLYRAVERTKVALSQQEEARFVFQEPPVEIVRQVSRAQFEGWISEDLESIAACVDRILAKAGVAAQAVDRVFMTGGSSFVPAVRRIFEHRFGAERLKTGDELTSVARGLALRGLDAMR